MVGLLAAALSVIGAFSPWCAVIAGVLTIPVVIVQYATQGNAVIEFSDDDWEDADGGFRLRVHRDHSKGPKPNVSVYLPTDEGGFEEVMCDVHTLPSGEVLIYASSRLAGEVRIS